MSDTLTFTEFGRGLFCLRRSLGIPELFGLRHLCVGSEAPDIEGEDQDGQRFHLSDYRGKVVLLDFWSYV